MARYTKQINTQVEKLLNLDVSVEDSTEQQGKARYEITIFACCHVASLNPKIKDNGFVLEDKVKRATNKELFAPLQQAGKTSKDGVKKIGQGIFNPKMLELALSVECDAEKLKAKVKKELTVKDGKKIVKDAGTFKGLISSLPKQDQGKASQSDKVDKDMKENSVDGSYDLMKKIFNEIIRLDLANLKKVFSFITNLENTSEPMISNQDDQDIIVEKLPMTFSHFSKIVKDAPLNQNVA